MRKQVCTTTQAFWKKELTPVYARAKAGIRGTGLYSFLPSLLRISEGLFLKQTTGRCVGCTLVGGLGPPPTGQLFEVCRNALGLPLPGLPWILAAGRPGRGYCSPETGGQAPPGPHEPAVRGRPAFCTVSHFTRQEAGGHIREECPKSICRWGVGDKGTGCSWGCQGWQVLWQPLPPSAFPVGERPEP